MEPINRIINKIVSFALLDPRIEAIVLTGSIARQTMFDRFSDVDIELIGSGCETLWQERRWINQFGKTLVVLALANEDEDSPDWPTCLSVYEQGRKVDFMLAGRDRIEKMQRQGLDDIYQRGYSVLLDKTGITNKLPEYADPTTLLSAPNFEQFFKNWQNFWFEATQVPISILRDEMWTARNRDQDMKNDLIEMFEWYTFIISDGKQDTWYNGRHLSQWLAPEYHQRFLATMSNGSRQNAATAHIEMLTLYREVALTVLNGSDFAIEIELADKVIDLAKDLFASDDLYIE